MGHRAEFDQADFSDAGRVGSAHEKRLPVVHTRRRRCDRGPRSLKKVRRREDLGAGGPRFISTRLEDTAIRQQQRRRVVAAIHGRTRPGRPRLRRRIPDLRGVRGMRVIIVAHRPTAATSRQHPTIRQECHIELFSRIGHRADVPPRGCRTIQVDHLGCRGHAGAAGAVRYALRPAHEKDPARRVHHRRAPVAGSESTGAHHASTPRRPTCPGSVSS